MTEEELFKRLRAGDVGPAINDFLSAHREMTLFNISMSLANSDALDLAEIAADHFIETEPENSDAYWVRAVICRRQGRREDMIEACEAMLRADPQLPQVYKKVCNVLAEAGEPDVVRKTIQAGQQKIPDGLFVDFQPGWRLRHFLSPEQQTDFSNRLASRLKDLRRSRQTSEDRTPEKEIRAPSGEREPDDGQTKAVALTGGAWEVGAAGVTLSADVAAKTARAEYRFEYGAKPDDLGAATPWKPAPGPLNARVTLAPETAPESCRIDATDGDWDEATSLYLFNSPFGFDTNHLSGLGFLSLLFSARPMSCQPDGRQEYQDFETYDLRGSEYRLRLRLNQFEARDFLFCAGLSSSGSPWVSDANPIDLEDFGADDDITMDFDLASTPGAWTFMGNNPRDQVDAERYRFAPLDRTLSHGTDMIFFIGVSGDWRRAPEGAFGVREATLRCRSRCVLSPQNGGRLVECSATGASDPGKLTDGNRGQPGDGWFQLGAVTAPIVFKWRLPKPVKIATVVFHQDLAMPATKCRLILGNMDGTEERTNATGAFDLPADEDLLSSVSGKVLRLPGDQAFDLFGIEILESGSPEGVGMEAIEVFAADFVPPPSPTPVTVSETAEGLTPGAQIYYRVVCRTNEGETQGEVREFDLPTDERPILSDLKLFKTTPDKSVIALRGNAMGHETVVKWRLGDDPWNEVSLGWEKSGAHRYITVRDQSPGSSCRLTAKLVSNQGDSEEKSVTWIVPGNG